MANEKEAAKKVAKRVKKAMAVLIRNVAGHNWGWFSREDERMHVQTVDTASMVGPAKAKAWLETRGRRTFEPTVMGATSPKDWKKLEAQVRVERDVLERRWIHFMVENGWIKATLKGSIITVTAYPGTHNSFTRTIDLRPTFPGAYPHWDTNPPIVDFDRENGMLRVGRQANPDYRNHLDMGEFLFVD
jgi:hypothetical protein